MARQLYLPTFNRLRPKKDLNGRVLDCSKRGFLLAMDVSCWSFIRIAKLAERLMKDGGTILTMSAWRWPFYAPLAQSRSPAKPSISTAATTS